MLQEKTKGLTTWFNTILSHYQEYTKKTGLHRCKVIGLNYNREEKACLTVRISGIKNHSFIDYFPEELVANDKMLQEFCQADVRAITFYAIKNSTLTENNYKKEVYTIAGQEFLNNMTVFLIKQHGSEGMIRKTAHELYADKITLKQFNLDDLINIIQIASQEKMIEDIMD